MAYENFPHKSPGDILTAKHINDLSSVARRIAPHLPGSNVDGLSSSVHSLSSGRPHVQQNVIVTQSLGSDQYKVRLRYYKESTGSWATLTSANEFPMDASESGQTFSINDKIVVYWHEQRGKFIPTCCQGEQQAGDTMEWVSVCNDITNECCLLEGNVIRITSFSDTCDMAFCVEEVWITCLAGQLLPDTPVPGMNNFCGWGKLIANSHRCETIAQPDGDDRKLFAVDCGDCGCTCPAEGDELPAVLYINDNDCSDLSKQTIDFTMACVYRDPITQIPPDAGRVAFWGEFEMIGFYPLAGPEFALVNPITLPGTSDTAEHITVVPCGEVQGTTFDPCNPDHFEIWAEDGSDNWYKISGSFEIDSNLTQGKRYVLDERGCLAWCERRFKYGVYFECIESTGTFQGFRFYHLKPDLTRVLDACDNLSVPDIGSNIPDAAGTLGSNKCCFNTYINPIAKGFGDTLNCTINLNGDTSGQTVDISAYEYHVMGGCKKWVLQEYQDLQQFFSAEDNTGEDCVSFTPFEPLPYIQVRINPRISVCEDEDT